VQRFPKGKYPHSAIPAVAGAILRKHGDTRVLLSLLPDSVCVGGKLLQSGSDRKLRSDRMPLADDIDYPSVAAQIGLPGLRRPMNLKGSYRDECEERHKQRAGLGM